MRFGLQEILITHIIANVGKDFKVGLIERIECYNEFIMEPIKLNDLLQLTEEQIANTKIRFMTPSVRIGFNPNRDAEDLAKQDEINLRALVYNREKSVSFNKGTIAIGFIRVDEDQWLMTGIVKVTKDGERANYSAAEYLTKKFNFRLMVRFHKYFQNGIIGANTITTNTESKDRRLIDLLDVIEIWNPEKGVGDNSFPGYKNVSISYHDLKRKIDNSREWRAELKSRKGVYLISDKNTGKQYVGSAYGEDGILGRWRVYLKSGYDKNEKESNKYPNKKLKELVEEKGLRYIQENFQYSILETFTDDVSDEYIIARESFWKEVLLTRIFGYNAN